MSDNTSIVVSIGLVVVLLITFILAIAGYNYHIKRIAYEHGYCEMYPYPTLSRVWQKCLEK